MSTAIDELPNDWERSKIGERCAVVSGATPKTGVPENWGGDIPWITPDDLSKNREKVVTGGARTLSDLGYGSCSTTLVPAGTVVFSSRAPIGYVAIAGTDLCTNQGFKSAVPDETLSSDFLYWQLQYVTPEIRSRASGTTFLEISKKGFADTAIVVPPLAEQERIVEILEEHLSRLDTALDSIRAIRKKSAGMRQSLLHAAFTRSEAPWRSSKESAWRVSTISDEGVIVSGSTPKTAVSDYWGGGIAWLTPDDLSKNRSKVVFSGARTLTKAGFDSCSTAMVPAGAVLYTSRAPIGYVAIAGDELCTNQGFKTIVPGERVTSEFLYWQLQHCTKDIRSRANGTTFLEIGKKAFGKTAIAVPPIEEQRRVVALIEAHVSRLENLGAAIVEVEATASSLRRSLLHAAFTGRLTEDWREQHRG